MAKYLFVIAFVASVNAFTIKICHNKDCCKQGGGEQLLNTFRDLIPSTKESDVVIESSGCLSQCGKGPNVLAVGNSNDEKLYFGVDSPTAASAVLEVVSGDEYPINLLIAATSIHDAEKVTSPSKKEELLRVAIEALSEEEDKSFARAHALYLRADARLELDKIDDAIKDAKLSTQINPQEGKAWCKLARAHEAKGNINEAVKATKEWIQADQSTKAKRELERLYDLM